jgi:uncharacterized membrane protein
MSRTAPTAFETPVAAATQTLIMPPVFFTALVIVILPLAFWVAILVFVLPALGLSIGPYATFAILGVFTVALVLVWTVICAGGGGERRDRDD